MLSHHTICEAINTINHDYCFFRVPQIPLVADVQGPAQTHRDGHNTTVLSGEKVGRVSNDHKKKTLHQHM